MKFSSGVFNLIVVGGIATAESMSIRGNTKTANKLITFARRVEDAAADNSGGYYNNNNGNGGYNNNYNGANNGGQNGQYSQYGQAASYGGNYGEMDEESMYFLNNYSIKLLSCIQGEQVVNYENGETESSTVVFRLCPSGSCDADSELGCESGYGDYAVGINTFLDAYMEQQQDNQNYYGNGMISYSQYGQEFDAEEYMECKEYNVEEGQDQQQNNYNQYNNNQYNNNGQQQQNNYNQYSNNGQQQQQNNYNQYNQNNNNQYNNGQRRQENNYNNYYQNAQLYIGPGCSADGTTIVLGMYMDEYCSYPSETNFADIAYGWESGLPFSDGGLVSMNCVACYGQDEDYNYELSEMCTESYQSSTSRCESNMESFSYYGQSTQGCNYIDSLVESIYGTDDIDGTDGTDNSTLTNTWTTVNDVSTRFMDTLSTREVRSFIAAMVLFSLSAFFGASLIGCFCVKKRRAKRAAKGNKLLPEAEPIKKRRSSVVALVRSSTNGFAESVKTATTGVKVVVATAAAKSVASIRGKPSKKEEKDSTEIAEVVYTDMEDSAAVEDESVSGKVSVKTHKSIKSRMSSMAAKTVASVRKASTKKKTDDTKSINKSEYQAPEPIVSASAATSVKSSTVVVKDDASARSTKSKAASVISSKSSESKAAPVPVVTEAAAAALVAVEEASIKSTKSKAVSIKSSKSSKSKAASLAPVVVAEAALVAVKEDASVKSIKSKAASVKSSKSSKSKAPVVAAAAAVPVAVSVNTAAASVSPTPTPVDAPVLPTPTPVDVTTPSTPERRADVLDWMFGCGGKDDNVAAGDDSVTSDIVDTTSATKPVAPEPAPVVAETDVTEPVAPEPAPVEDTTPVSTATEPAKEAKPATEEDSKPAQDPEPATVEPATVEPTKEEVAELEATTVLAKEEVSEPTEAEPTPETAAALVKETPAKSTAIDAVISEEKSTTHSEKTEKTKGKKSFLTKMDNHLKKKLSKKE